MTTDPSAALRNTVIAALALCFAGCATKRISPRYTEEQVKAFRNMAVVDPILNLWEAGSGEASKAIDLEAPTRSHFRSRLSGFAQRTSSSFYALEGMSPADRDSLASTLDSSFFSSEIDAVRVPQNLLSIGKEDYVLFSYFAGTYKTKSRQRREFWKSLGIGVATLGLVVPVYYPGSCELYSVLIDKRNRRVVYTDRVGIYDDFRKESVLNKVLDKSIDKFYARR